MALHAREPLPEETTCPPGLLPKGGEKRFQGVGLGLPIVDGLVRLHGGLMQIRSKVNAGTEVIIEFPQQCVPKGSPIRSALAA